MSKNHVTHQNLADFITDSLSKKRSLQIENHLNECPRCKGVYDKLMSIQTPVFRGRAILSENTKARVLNTYDLIVENKDIKKELGRVIEFPVKKLALAAAALVFVVFSTVIGYRFYEGIPRNVTFTLAEVTGQVFVNRERGERAMVIEDENTITTGPNSTAILRYGDSMAINIHSNSAFTIEKAVITKALQDTDFLFSLTEGSLISSINMKDIKYVYITPSARIESRGTEFFVHASGEKTTVYMKKGSVKISTHQSKEEIVTEEEKKYIITDTISVILSAEDLRLYESLRKLSQKGTMKDIDRKRILIRKREESKLIDEILRNMFKKREKPKKIIVPKEETTEEKKEPKKRISFDQWNTHKNKREEIREDMRDMRELRKSRRSLRNR